MYNSPNGQGISMTISGLYPSRSEESYALWLEFPKATVNGKGNQIQHANFVKKMVSQFTVSATGVISTLDTVNLVAKLGYPLALATYAIISVEKTDSIASLPRSAFLGGNITGDAATGSSTLVVNHPDALNYDFSGMTAAITLANAPGKPVNDLELYLMNATSPTNTFASINNLTPLPGGWEYALWAVDSSTKSLPPFNIYYGTFTTPDGVDSQPGDNHYNYPGGRYPADSTLPIYDLRSSGKVTAMMVLEPITNGMRPLVPFGAIISQVTISSSAQGFTPIPLINRAALFPTATLTINR